MQIQDMVVLVTGGNRGLGKALVDVFLEAGVSKIYVGSRVPVASSDPRLHPIKLDITSEQDITTAAETCQDINVLVNNAGVGNFQTFLSDGALDEARTTIETNYLGTLAMAQAFAPILKRNGGGILVNVLSVLSWFASPALGPYSASKAAELALTEVLRIELSAQGTQVTAVHVGYMETDMAASVNDVKVHPRDVAAHILDGIQHEQEEVLADETSRNLKVMLANNRQAFYQSLQQNR